MLIPSSLDPSEAENPDLKKLGSLSDEQQDRVNEWLEAKHPVLHELYRSLCALVYREEIPGQARLIAHCIREIRNVLLSHIVAEESRQLQYSKELDAIAREWAKTGPKLDGITGDGNPTATPASTGSNVQIDVGLATQIYRLIEQHNSTRDTNFEKTTRLFENFQITNPEGATSLAVLAKNWKDLVDYFVSIVHERIRTDSDLISDEFVRNVHTFEQSMHHFATAPAFFEGLEEIDEILEQANS